MRFVSFVRSIIPLHTRDVIERLFRNITIYLDEPVSTAGQRNSRRRLLARDSTRSEAKLSVVYYRIVARCKLFPLLIYSAGWRENVVTSLFPFFSARPRRSARDSSYVKSPTPAKGKVSKFRNATIHAYLSLNFGLSFSNDSSQRLS